MPHIKANDIDTYYEWSATPSANSDSAPVIVLSNSLSSNLSMWDKQIETLVGLGFRVLRYDSRGHGKSSAPDVPYTIEMLTDDVVGLLDALGIELAHFCGLSMGGMIGQCLATRFPNRLKSVTLCATAAYLNAPGVWDERRALVERGGMDAVLEGTIQRWFSPSAQQNIPQDLDMIRTGILQTPTVGYANCCLAIRDMDQREAIRSITVPTLVIAGENDPSTTVEAAREIVNAIDGAELAVIPGAQHLLNIEMATQFNALLGQFLSAHK